MAKGSSARSGPPPDPNALRRDRKDDAGWTTLPAEGREGPVPEWPLKKQTARERLLWKREWKRPQAVEWERNGQQDEVAMYVRSLTVAEAHDASVSSRTLLRQQQESLGISLPGLARNRWRIEGVATPASKQQRRRSSSAKSRFKVLDGGQGS